MRLDRFVTGALCLYSFYAASGEPDPVDAVLSSFELKDGKCIQVMSYTTSTQAGEKSYVVTRIDGTKTILFSKDVASIKEEKIPESQLPEQVRAELTRKREARASAAQQSKQQAADDQNLLVLKRAEAEARIASTKLTQELSAQKKVLLNAETVLKNTPLEIVREETRYDAAKTELGSIKSCLLCSLGGPCSAGHRSAETLRKEMERAAVEKARFQALLKEAELALKRTQTTLAGLEPRVENADKELKKSEAASRAAILKMKNGDGKK